MWAIDSNPNPDETNEKWSEFSAKVRKLWQWLTPACQNRWFLRDGTLVVLLTKHNSGHVARIGTHCRSCRAEPARYAYWLGRFSRFLFYCSTRLLSAIPRMQQVVERGTIKCTWFSSESIQTGYLYLENYLISCLNDYCKRKKTPKNGYLDRSGPLLP